MINPNVEKESWNWTSHQRRQTIVSRDFKYLDQFKYYTRGGRKGSLSDDLWINIAQMFFWVSPDGAAMHQEAEIASWSYHVDTDHHISKERFVNCKRWINNLGPKTFLWQLKKNPNEGHRDWPVQAHKEVESRRDMLQKYSIGQGLSVKKNRIRVDKPNDDSSTRSSLPNSLPQQTERNIGSRHTREWQNRLQLRKMSLSP